MNRQDAAERLNLSGWPAIAEDILEGKSTTDVLSTLREIGESNSLAAAIVRQISGPWAIRRTRWGLSLFHDGELVASADDNEAGTKGLLGLAASLIGGEG